MTDDVYLAYHSLHGIQEECFPFVFATLEAAQAEVDASLAYLYRETQFEEYSTATWVQNGPDSWSRSKYYVVRVAVEVGSPREPRT